MDYSNLTLFSLMRSKLNYLSERHSVLAQNVANADTPGYKAKDVEAPDFHGMLKKMGGASQTLPMTLTSPGHVTAQASPQHFRIEKRHDTYELNPDGNNVSIEEEMKDMAENQADYTEVLNLYRKTVEMFKTAIGRPTGAG